MKMILSIISNTTDNVSKFALQTFRRELLIQFKSSLNPHVQHEVSKLGLPLDRFCELIRATNTNQELLLN